MKSAELRKRIRRVRLVVFDCDGVLTDGGIVIGADGREAKRFNVHDGSGIKYLQRGGIGTAILSGRRAAAVAYRAKELGIAFVLQGFKRKADGLEKLIRGSGTPAEEICYVGDDLPDIPVMRAVGVAVAVADARPEVRRAAHWVTRAAGGRGAAREVAERILKVQGKWVEVAARYGLKAGRGLGGRQG